MADVPADRRRARRAATIGGPMTTTACRRPIDAIAKRLSMIEAGRRKGGVVGAATAGRDDRAARHLRRPAEGGHDRRRSSRAPASRATSTPTASRCRSAASTCGRHRRPAGTTPTLRPTETRRAGATSAGATGSGVSRTARGSSSNIQRAKLRRPQSPLDATTRIAPRAPHDVDRTRPSSADMRWSAIRWWRDGRSYPAQRDVGLPGAGARGSIRRRAGR